MEFGELKKLYNEHFTLPVLSNDVSEKFALISLVCYLTFKLKSKKPDVTPWTVLYQLNKKCREPVKEEWLKALAVLCEDFMYGCDKFPTFDLKDKEIPEKIQDFLKKWLPF